VANIFILIGEDDYRGKGFGKLAMNYLINFGFKELKLNRLELEVNLDNLPALNLYKKIGFREEKRSDTEAKFFLDKKDSLD
jgi:RimJ/RimL family protein N-acetyltransferase